MLLAVAGLLLLASGAPGTVPADAPRPAAVVILRDGTRYTVTKPYEIRGTQARLSLVGGSLVAVRASEIDEEASKRATGAAEAPPPNSGPLPPQTLTSAASASAEAPKKATKSITIEGEPSAAYPVSRSAAPAAGTPAATATAAAAGETAAPTTSNCDTATFKGDLDAVVARFSGERTTARATPRIALAGQVSILRAVRTDFSAIAAKAPPCASAVVREAGAWMDVVIESLDVFLGNNDSRSIALERKADEVWRRYQGERYYLP